MANPRPMLARLWPPLAAVSAGGVLSLAYPTWDVGGALWAWMFPMLAALWLGAGRRTKKRAFGFGWLAGFTFFFLVLGWLHDIHGAGRFLSLLGWFALSAYLGCYFGLWALFASTIGRLDRARMLPPGGGTGGACPGLASAPSVYAIRQATVNAAAWVVLEWLRGWLLGGFGWNGLGVGMHENLPLIQMAEFTGVAGLSFLPVFVSICLFAAAWRLCLRVAGGAGGRIPLNLDFSVAMALVAVVFLFGWSKVKRHARDGKNLPRAEVAVVQRNIPQDLKWEPTRAMEHLQGYYDAFAGALRDRADGRAAAIEKAMREGGKVAVNLAPPDIVLLPESALPLYLADPNVEDFRDAILEAAGPGSVLVTGINDAEPGDPPRFFNTIAVLKSDASEPTTYRKMNLVPFGEYLPMRWFPPMRWLAGDAIPGDFEPGASTDPLRVDLRAGPIEMIPLICFEDTLGRHARRFARDGLPQILVNATNDGWFKDPAAALQHAANAKFRCVELRRPMIRAANTGLSCAIDATGGMIADLREPGTRSPQVAGVMFASVPLQPNPPLTFFARFGDVFALACGILVLAAAVFGWSRGRKVSESSSARPPRSEPESPRVPDPRP